MTAEITYRGTALYNGWDSPYHFDDYGVGRTGWLHAEVGDRLFTLSHVAWYGRKDDNLMPSRTGVPDDRQLIAWHVWNLDPNDASSMSVADSWQSHATDVLDPGTFDTPLLGVQDDTSPTTANGDLRFDYNADSPWEQIIVFNEDADFHWLAYLYDPELTGNFIMTYFKIRKSDGKVFRPDGQLGFPSASRGEDIILSWNDSALNPNARSFGRTWGPVRTSDGLLVGVTATSGTSAYVLAWKYTLSGSTLTRTSTEESLIRTTEGAEGYVGSTMDAVTYDGGVVALYSSIYDYDAWSDPETNWDGSILVTIDSDGRLIDTYEDFDGKPPSLQTTMPAFDGVVVAGYFNEYDGGNWLEAWADEYCWPVNWVNGQISAPTRRPIPGYENGTSWAGDPSSSGLPDPPWVVPLSVRGTGGGAAYYWVNTELMTEAAGGPEWYAGVRLVTVSNLVLDYRFTESQFDQEIDDALLASLNVAENGRAIWVPQAPYYARFPEDSGFDADMIGSAPKGDHGVVVNFAPYRSEDPQDGGATLTTQRLMEVTFIDVFHPGIEFDFSTGPSTRRMGFSRSSP